MLLQHQLQWFKCTWRTAFARNSATQAMTIGAAAPPPGSTQRYTALLLGIAATTYLGSGLCKSSTANFSESESESASAATGTTLLQGEPLRPLLGSKVEPSLWDTIKGAFRRPAGAVEEPLPLDKLSCKLKASPAASASAYQPVVLVSCGSFNPPTFMHLRMFELAMQQLIQDGYDVLGGYLSPVNDAYGKAGLEPAHHRLRMCRLAVDDSPHVMVDGWEATQPTYQRSLAVLKHVAARLQDSLQDKPAAHNAGPSASRDSRDGHGTAQHSASTGPEGRAIGSSTSGTSTLVDSTSPGRPPAHPRAVLLCGADLLESFTKPGVWRDEHVVDILAHHGVVCIARKDSDVEALLQVEGTVLHTYRQNVTVIHDPVQSDISSTTVRKELIEGRSVRYLIPDLVINYIKQQGLYS